MQQRETWRFAGATIAVLMFLAIVLYQPTISYLLGFWDLSESGNYTHGYLVLLVSVYLVFYNRQKLAQLTPCPEYKAFIAVATASVIWVLAAIVDIVVLQAVGLLLLLLSMVWLLLGTRATRILAFPILFICFAIPVWFPLSPILQELTADAVFWIVRALEIPALRIENMIVVPAGRLSIEEFCGGLNFFLAAMTLATLYAYLNYRNLSSRLIVVLITASAAVSVNILRVFILVYLGYATDMQHPLIADHLSFGWYLFAGLVVVLLVTDTLLHKFRQQPRTAGLPHDNNTLLASCNKSKSQFYIITLLAAFFVSAGPVSVYWLASKVQQDGPGIKALSELVPADGEWTVAGSNQDDWMPYYQGAKSQKTTFVNTTAQQVHLYIGWYLAQKQGEELINEVNSISDEKIWYSSYERAKLYDAGGQKVLEQLLEKKDGTKRLVWYWYHIAGQNTVNKYHAKALQVLGLMSGIRQASVVAISARLDDDPVNTREILRQFAEAITPSINEMMDSKI